MEKFDRRREGVEPGRNEVFRRRGVGFGLLGLVVAIQLWPFSGGAALVQAERGTGVDFGKVKRVAFLPLFRVGEAGPSVLCPVGGELFSPGVIADAAEAELSRTIGRALLTADLPLSWIPQAEINAAREKLKKEGHAELTTQGGWQMAIARELQADAVLFGFIYTYRERVGGDFAASQSAALAFCLHLVEPSTNRILWSFRYEDEQRPLLEDLTQLVVFLKRKGRWITVQQMAAEAAAALLGHLPWAGHNTPPPRRTL